MNGHFNEFKKREKINVINKAKQRTRLKSKKEQLIDFYSSKTNEELHYPSASKSDLKNIRQKVKKKNRKEFLIFTTFLALVVIVSLYFLNKYLNH